MNRPLWPSLQNVLIGLTTIEVNPCSFAVLIDQKRWTISAKNSGKSLSPNLFFSVRTVSKSDA
ncbi:unnamed protein product [Hymenolepis diminuta]|uniref:Uncharacterized protein n=1 Tax=Hymenolepis diminuta TaxID=6216 RepID=A0A564YLC1_HYMDI|nr:unnamed protein product [Hymenolepis diminuta]